MTTIDQQFVEYVVKNLVEHPDDVKVERLIDEKGVLLTLTVHPEDLGRVIGRRGSNASSLRTLLRALGAKNDARYNLKIVDNNPQGDVKVDKTEEAVAETDETVEKQDEIAKKAHEELAQLDNLDI